MSIMFYKIPNVLRKRSTKTLISVFLTLLLVYTFFGPGKSYNVKTRLLTEEEARKIHEEVIKAFVETREDWTTSKLGSSLFKFKPFPVPQNRNFSILVWKYWDWLTARHVNRYSSSEQDPLEGCSVNNCIFTGEDDKLATVDAVVVHLQRGLIPVVENRNPLQRWIFLNDESPNNVFSLAKKKVDLKDFADVFNWSMTFRTDADVPVPYGRTVVLQEPVFNNLDTNSLKEIIPNWKKKRRDVLAAIVISNCKVKFRLNFIAELQKHIPVDVFGECSTNKTNKHRCPGHFRSDCEPTSDYLFYLALENSNCFQYLTEKIWYQSYMKGAIPIIIGPTFSDCKRLLPPNSFIYISMEFNAAEIKDLANYITNLSENEESLLSLHEWRNHFKVMNENGYFGTQSFHLCRLCEAMNYNDVGQKIYTESDLRWFLDPKLMCKI